VSWLCAWLDRQSESRGKTVLEESIYCCIIGTTNRPEDVDARLRRGGRLGLELEVYTSRQDRVGILGQLLRVHCAASIQSGAISTASIDEVVERVVDRLGNFILVYLIVHTILLLYCVELT